ncbi:MAG: hypothetical protein HXX16_20085 [Bacteroidales bacterium]|nr:hypothetical protein [Bacteroidales bacterium]
MKALIIISFFIILLNSAIAQDNDTTIYYQILNQRIENYYELSFSNNGSPEIILKKCPSFKNFIYGFDIDPIFGANPTLLKELGQVDSSYIKSQINKYANFIWLENRISNKKVKVYSPKKNHKHLTIIRSLFRKRTISTFHSSLSMSIPIFINKNKLVAIVYEDYSCSGPDLFQSGDLNLYFFENNIWKKVASKLVRFIMS